MGLGVGLGLGAGRGFQAPRDLGDADDVVDLGRPALEEVAQVRAHALRLLFARLGRVRVRVKVRVGGVGFGSGVSSGSGEA